MNYVIEPPAQASVAVTGTEDRFPVRRIFCVGRNYEAHAREMGKDPDRDPPFFFTKPADALVDTGATVPYPAETGNFHYEAELVVAIGKGGFRISEESAAAHIYGYAVGNDLTRRDLQLKAREAGRPWDWGKAFDRSAPCAPIHPIAQTGELTSGSIRLTVNGETKQDSDLKLLIWDVREIISILSHSMELKAGDLIYTGTPEGVGPIKSGDTVIVSIDGLTDCVTHIGDPV